MSSSHHVKYPRELAAHLLPLMKLRGRWNVVVQQLAHGDPMGEANDRNFRVRKPLPSEEELEKILDIAYVTSLCVEEGRACTLTVAYVPPLGAAELGEGTFTFAAPLPFEPSQLRKLAPATEPAVTCIALWHMEGGGLGIWGLLHQGDHRLSLDRELRPDYLQVRVLRPGAFTVHYGGSTVALFVTDHWHIFESDLGLVGMLRGPLTDENRAREFVRLASRMLSLGHGGTILIVDRQHAISGLIPHPAFSHPGSPATLLTEAFAAHEHFSSGEERQRNDETDAHFHRRRRDAERAHSETLDFVAKLTAVDGAVVMQDDLSVVGFGATIQMATVADPVVVLEDPRHPGSEVETPVSSIGGHRHRSAVMFCMQQDGLALALVASQDGDLSLVGRKDDGRAHVIRPFELGEGL
jgi:Probable sensor domain DACNV